MSVRKRTWKSPSGEMKEAWVVDYVDQYGGRHIKTFAKKRDADAHHAIVRRGAASARPAAHAPRAAKRRQRRQAA
jgi:integrase